MKKYLLIFSLWILILQKALFAAPTYTCGYQRDNNLDRATLWITEQEVGTKVTYLGNSSANSYAYSVVILGQKIYIVGTQRNASSVEIATLWITDLNGQGLVTKRIGEALNPSFARSIIIFENRLYVTGYQDDGEDETATLWIGDLSGDNFLMKKIGGPVNDSIARSIKVLRYEKTLYLVGFQEDNQDRNAVLWITDLNGENVKNKPLASLEDESHAVSIDLFDNKLYIVGYLKTQGGIENTTLWVVDLDGNVILTKRIGNNLYPSKGESLAVVDGKIYIVGYQNDGSKNNPALWLTNLKGEVSLVTILEKNASNYEARSVAILQNKVNIVGGPQGQQFGSATLWKTNLKGAYLEKILLGNGVSRSLASFILPKPIKNLSLKYALDQFSSVSYQKGI